MINEKMIFETTKSFLFQMAKYSGFSPKIGLYDGKMGAVIVLYQGMRYFHLPELENFADTLLEDILEESKSIVNQDFSTGLSGIAWGVNYLIENGFIESDDNFFDDIDKFLFNKEKKRDKEFTEHILLGLYIQSRYKNSRNSDFWIEEANSYCTQILDIIDSNKEIFVDCRISLAPFWYCLSKWDGYKFPFMEKNKIIEKTCISLLNSEKGDSVMVKTAFANELIRKLSYSNEKSSSLKILTLSDINDLYLNQLIYGMEVSLPAKVLIDSTINRIINDSTFHHHLSLLLNPLAMGISQPFAGFTWSLVQYCIDQEKDDNDI